MRVQEVSLKNKYLIISTIAFCIIGFFVYVATETQVQGFLLEQTKVSYNRDVQDKASQNFNLELPLSLRANGKIGNFIESVQTETGATKLKLYDPNGVAVYSPTNKEVGQNFSDVTQIKTAIGGNTVTEKVDFNSKTMLTFTPIKSANGEVRGVLAALVPLDQNIQYAKRFSLELDGIIGIIALFFGGAVYFTFSSAEADMVEKDHSLVDRSKAFEEEKQLDDAIMASMAESLTVINKDGQIMVFNPETERLTGLKADEVEFRLYLKILNFYDKDGKGHPNNPITETLKTAKPTQATVKDGFYLRSKDNVLIPVSVSVAPIIDKDKKIQGVAATIQDISAEKELDAVKDEFVYVVAHELGNPVFALDGYLSIIENQTKKSGKEVQDLVSSARAVNAQLSELVNDLLEVTRNEQGTLKFELAPVNLEAITQTVIKNAQFKAKSKNIKLEYKSGKISEVRANEQKIKEVLTNFVDNAIKYTPEGGKVWVGHEQNGNELVTFVRDNGLGIKTEDQEKLFSKFYRVRTDKTANISGTGLGLFICRQIVEKCGGRVWAESAEGKGSTFYFALKTTK